MFYSIYIKINIKKKMKDPNMIRATNQFQTIIDRYKRNNKLKKVKNSLNSLFVKDLNQVRNYNNFSDEEYMINEIKNENKIKNDKSLKNKYKLSNYSNMNLSNEKISKDLFFYYRNKIEERNNNLNQNNNKIPNLRYNSASFRMDSGKRSIDSSQTLNSKRRKSNFTLILPLINSRNNNYNLNKKNLSNNRSFISDDDTINIINFPQTDQNNKTEISKEIEKEENKNNKKKEKNVFLKYSKINTYNIKNNNFYKMNINNILKNLRMKKSEKELFYKLNLPLIENDIFNKINKVTKKSETISKNINYLSTEGNIAFEN